MYIKTEADKELIKFTRELKKRGGHILDSHMTSNSQKIMVYYTEYGDFAMHSRIKTF